MFVTIVSSNGMPLCVMWFDSTSAEEEKTQQKRNLITISDLSEWNQLIVS